ncbi:MAG: beta-ketoacyl synthase N-terminal-like domain-containing protein, partial [Thermodesulfobacteriota bacterium]
AKPYTEWSIDILEAGKAEITGIGWITAAGTGRGRDHKGFTLPMGRLPEYTPEKIFTEPYPNLRRMDDYSRLGVTAIALTLQDAGLDTWTRKRDIGMVVATVYGCLGADVDYYNTVIPNQGAHASPAVFSYTSANSFLGEAAIRFGLTGTNYAISEQRPTGLAGLNAALGHVARGDDEKMMGGVCDVGCPEIFGQPDKFPAGVLFFMLEAVGTNPQNSFGILASESPGQLIFNGDPVNDISTLVNQCLRSEFINPT